MPQVRGRKQAMGRPDSWGDHVRRSRYTSASRNAQRACRFKIDRRKRAAETLFISTVLMVCSHVNMNASGQRTEAIDPTKRDLDGAVCLPPQRLRVPAD